MTLKPRVPRRLHPLSREVLEELRRYPAAEGVIIGGGVALQHYCEFRDTVDLDAWWAPDATQASEEAVRSAMAAIADRRGLKLVVRSWRETQSFELVEHGSSRKVFSFQIAWRTTQVTSPQESAWPPVRIEAFSDNLRAKMKALVDRGAPRDFLDIHEVCHRRLASTEECWEMWRCKSQGLSTEEGALRVLHHLEVIEARRPLDSIGDDLARESARALREWVRTRLCATAEGRHED